MRIFHLRWICTCTSERLGTWNGSEVLTNITAAFLHYMAMPSKHYQIFTAFCSLLSGWCYWSDVVHGSTRRSSSYSDDFRRVTVSRRYCIPTDLNLPPNHLRCVVGTGFQFKISRGRHGRSSWTTAWAKAFPQEAQKSLKTKHTQITKLATWFSS